MSKKKGEKLLVDCGAVQDMPGLDCWKVAEAINSRSHPEESVAVLQPAGQKC